MTVWVFYASMIVFFGAELTYVRFKRSAGERYDRSEVD
jgi:uncharacterized BrkB/YihY/UPF0761 family membrane protein